MPSKKRATPISLQPLDVGSFAETCNIIKKEIDDGK